MRTLPVAAVALLGVVAHLATLQRYGIFRDELYYVACGEHLAWGYVDHPPLVGVLAWIATHLLGGSLAALRILPILCGALTALVTASLVRRLGGGVWAQCLAALCVTVAPHYLFIFHILSMNAPEVLLWTLAARVLVEALEPGARWSWVLLGATVGLGALNKHSMLLWAAGLFAGVAATSRGRRALATRWPWIGGAVAALLFAPHVVWQVQNDWPLLEFVRNAQRGKIVALSPLAFLREQIMMMNPFAAAVWITGLVWCFTRSRRRPPAVARAFGWAWLVVLVLFLAQRSKAYYLTPAYPPLVAAGAVAIAAWTGRRWRWLRVAAPAVVLAGGVVTAPLVLPVLSPERFVAYQRALGMRSSSGERHTMGDLPQHFADMHGWEEMARAVSAVFVRLPPEERATARVYGQNYGEAGAIDYFRRRYDLPPAISGHNAYWTWGPGDPPTPGPILVIGGDPEDHAQSFARVEAAGHHDAAHAMPYERDLTIWLCRDLKRPANELWPAARHYD
jgi:hypothetical protein